LIRYRFDLQRATIPDYQELTHIIHAWSLEDAVIKFTRKHRLEAPAYWDEPTFDRFIEMRFSSGRGDVWYIINW